MGDGIGFAEALLGMRGFKITAVDKFEHGELVVAVETLEVRQIPVHDRGSGRGRKQCRTVLDAARNASR